MFYVLQAADKRNNRSPFTQPIILERPDITPPGSPIIVNLDQQTDSILIQWAHSGSNDVEEYELFRRNLDGTGGWAIVTHLSPSKSDSIYFDTELQYGNRYAYTMRAIDSTGLKSEMAAMKALLLTEPKVPFVPNVEIYTEFNEEKKEFILSCVNQSEQELASVLVYRGWDKEKLGKYKYVDSPDMSMTDNLEGHKKVYYQLKQNFKNNHDSFFSEVIEYVIEE